MLYWGSSSFEIRDQKQNFERLLKHRNYKHKSGMLVMAEIIKTKYQNWKKIKIIFPEPDELTRSLTRRRFTPVVVVIFGPLLRSPPVFRRHWTWEFIMRSCRIVEASTAATLAEPSTPCIAAAAEKIIKTIQMFKDRLFNKTLDIIHKVENVHKNWPRSTALV